MNPTIDISSGEYTGQPYDLNGYKTIAFEFYEQLGEVPDAVVVGDGDGLYGIWKGFVELDRIGVTDSRPRIVGVYSTERPASGRALNGDDDSDASDDPLPLTLSTGTASVGPHGVNAVRESDGAAYAIPKVDVKRAFRDTESEGIFLDPASAIPTAGVRCAAADGVVDGGNTAVCVVTGAGVEWPAHTADAIDESPVIKPMLDAFEAAVPFSIERFNR